MTEHEASNLVRLTDRLREFHALSMVRHGSYHALYADYLTTGIKSFDMEIGIVSRITDGQYTILAVEPDTTGLAAGDTMPVSDTYCSLVVSTGSTIAVPHAEYDDALGRHPAYQQQGLEAYIAAAIRVNGELYGTLNFTSPAPRADHFDETDIELIELMAARIGQIIEYDLLDRERQEALGRLRSNTILFESAFEYAAIGMALLAPDGRWLRVNRAITAIFGYSEEELLKLDFQTVTHPQDLDADLGYVQELLEGERESYSMEKRYFHKDGHEIWALLSVSMVRDEEGRPECFISQIQEITAQKRAEAEVKRRQKELESLNRKLEKLSTTDPLTKLSNRRALDEQVQKELHRSARTGHPLSLLMIDVDHFKRFNDTYGHPEGDMALRELAGALEQVARENDLVARVGGEEFIMLLPHTDEAGCHTVAARLSRAMSELNELETPITISTGGVTLLPTMQSTRIPEAAALMKSADAALYRAKQEGRNRHCQSAPLSC